MRSIGLILPAIGLVACHVGGALSSPLFGETNEPVEAKRPASAKSKTGGRLSVSRLVENLGHREYRVRRHATRELVRRGAEAVPALQRVVRNGPLEAAARAIIVLERIYVDLDVDESTLDRIETTLEDLRRSGRSSVAQLAGDVLTRHSGIRERRALAAIERLGGIIEYLPSEYTRNNGNNGDDGEETHIVNFVLLGSKWKGGDDGLKYIRRIRSLRNLYIARNKAFSPVSQEALDKLAADRPNLQIHERGLACLGVSGQQAFGGNTPGCYISVVKGGSAAAKGGMRRGDFVTSFGGKRVRDFQALVEEIAEYKPGEEVEVGVIRGGRQVKLKVVLQEWSK